MAFVRSDVCTVCKAALSAPWSTRNNKATNNQQNEHVCQLEQRIRNSLSVLLRETKSKDKHNDDYATSKAQKKAIRTAESIVKRLFSAKSEQKKGCAINRCIAASTTIASKNNSFWYSGLTVVDNVARPQHCLNCQTLLKKHSSILPPVRSFRPTTDRSDLCAFSLLSHAGLTALVQWLQTTGDKLRLDDAQLYDDVISAWLWRAKEEIEFSVAMCSASGCDRSRQSNLTCV